MDHAEGTAQRLIESVLPGTRLIYRPHQSHGEHDFDLHHSDGRISALEVTSSVDEVRERTNARILDSKQGGSVISSFLCRASWIIFPSVPEIRNIRKNVDRFLADIEAAGLDRFWGPTDCHPEVEAIYGKLGVKSGYAAPLMDPGRILIALPTGGSTVHSSLVIDAAQREAFKPDNRRKLGAAGTEETHLAVYVSLTSPSCCSLADCEPPSDSPALPPEITDVWVFSETAIDDQFVAWRGSRSLPWRKLHVHLPAIASRA